MTGWRIGQALALRRDELDLAAGTALASHRAAGNKAKQDVPIPLHPLAVEHLARLAGFSERVFAWPHHRRTLDVEWLRLQESAKIHLPCREEHEHTPACHVYGFHDLRRAFASNNVDLPEPVLQELMQHKAWQTTRGYINVGRRLRPVLANLHVPKLPGAQAGPAVGASPDDCQSVDGSDGTGERFGTAGGTAEAC